MNTKRILIVDDDSSIRKFVRVNLEARGYRVFTAGEGESGLRTAEKEQPDLVLLDIVMPEMDGFEVCRRIRKWSQVPVIMISARERENDKDICAACGANDYVTKPFVLRELLNQINKILKQE